MFIWESRLYVLEDNIPYLGFELNMYPQSYVKSFFRHYPIVYANAFTQ